MSKAVSSILLHSPLTLLLRLAPGYARALLLGVAALATWLILTIFGEALETAEERLGALGWTLYSEHTPEERITVVAIDEKSLAEVGPWPWPRDTMARLVTALDNAGVQLQIHDIAYPEPRPGDDALLRALSASSGSVLAQLPILQSDQQVQTGLMTHPLSGTSCSSVATSATSFIGNHPSFAAIPKGHIAPIVASDGSLRKVPAVICVNGQAFPILALGGLLTASGRQEWNATLTQGDSWFGPAQTLKLEAYPGLDVPLDRDGNLRISYRNHPDSYSAIPAVDVLEGRVDLSFLENAWVLVGATAFGSSDIVPTPYSGATPGVELQVRIIASLLDTSVPYTPRAADGLHVLLSLLFAASLFMLAGTQARFAHYGLPAAVVLLPILALLLHIYMLGGHEIWLGWVAPAVYGVVAACAVILLEQARVRSERSRVYGNLNSYLPADIAREIAYSLPNSSINARRCEVTLLSADLRNFSAFGESRPPEESAALLHYFFVKATEIVELNGGSIHEFKGDSLLAVWYGGYAEAAPRALEAAQQMQIAIQRDMLPQHPPSGLEPLALGIGIEQGPVLVGSIGPAHRRSHTMLGDTVTITLRIQEMTAELASPILVGECAARQLNDYKLESQGSYLLSGLQTPHTLFALPVVDLPKRRGRQDQVALTVVSGGLR